MRSLERGVRHPSTTWYFAEGATGVFDLYYLLLNPGTTAADVTITFLREVQEPVTKQVAVPANSRLTVRLMDFPELQAAALGAAITSTLPIVAEQAMYVSTESQFYAAGPASAATPTLATTVHFAEGATGLFFDEFLLLVNPAATPATATILYRFPDGTTLSKAYVIDPQRRRTVWLNYEAQSDPALAALASTAVGATVTSDLPIAVARKMYWPGLLLGGWGEASDAAGSTTTTLSAFIGGGLVGGPDQAAMFLLVLNTSADAGHVQVTVTPQTGSPVALTYPIAGNARLTVNLADFGIVDQPFSVAIESLASSPAVPLVVDVSSYTSPNGQFWAAGSASAASVPETPAGDTPPTVTATTPAAGATNVAVDANLTVTFSEPVNAGAGAFTLTCGATAVTLTNLTASPATTFTLDRATDLPPAASCTLTVVATEVTDADTDDPPDTPAADVTVTFTSSTCATIMIAPTTVPGGTVTLPYGPVPFTQTGGTPPITWRVSTGTLPAGLMLDATTGVLAGTPTASGPSAFTITATDANACTGAVPLTLSVLRLEWAMKFQLEASQFDRAFVEIQEVGGARRTRKLWEWLGADMVANVGNPVTTIQESGGWGRYRTLVNDFFGKTIRLRFHLDTDTTVQRAGLAIDDVSVTAFEP